MICRRLFLLAFSTLVAGAAAASDEQGNYAVWGPGRTSCNQFAQAYETGETAAHKAFLMGYLTAYNMLTDGTYNATGAATLTESMTWLDQYCDANKLDSFERAVKFLISSSKEKRQRVVPGTKRGWGRLSREPES